MSLRERIYSVLSVSSSQKFDEALGELMPKTRYSPVITVKSISLAKRALSERSFDFIIINSPLPDGTGERFAIDCADTSNTAVLLMVKADIHDDVHEKVSEYGVFTLPKPVSRLTVALALGWMESASERLQKAEKRTLSVKEKMEEIRTVNRAKWLLISELKMTEPEAHRYIEKQAMDRCITRKEVAREIIKLYS